MVLIIQAGDSVLMFWAVGRFAGSIVFSIQILGLAPQALCCRSLRELLRSSRTLVSRAFAQLGGRFARLSTALYHLVALGFEF